ncbi:MAG: phosphotransferase, partial [Polyangiaceae bacterium]
HDRRADRAADMILAYDTFGDIPRHVRAIDLGAIAADGSLRSLRQTGELYVLTTFADGHLYAEDLRRVARVGKCEERDVHRAAILGRYLAALHEPMEDAVAWTRALRDLIGSGEGIFGIVDGYPADAPGVGADRLQRIEESCLRWRWRLRAEAPRIVRTHGDFHPFNILFDEQDELALLDASRGCKGAAADDLTALAINYVFFALPRRATWRTAFAPLWKAFWESYRLARGAEELERDLGMAPPFMAWRALVVANPAWYPDVTLETRDAMLTLAERALDADGLDLDEVEELFA